MILYRKYSQTIEKSDPFSRVIRLFIKFLLNFLIPIAYKYKDRPENTKSELIVSVTTFPKRINKIWIVIESILRQTLQPKLVVLTLSKLQFSSKELLPANLLRLEKEGVLEIIWTDDDLRSHKKYYYVMKKYPNDIIVTVDDDIIYDDNLLKCLWEFHVQYPKSIIANNACLKKTRNYNNWENLKYEFHSPSYNIMPIGCGGVLYPPKSLPMTVFDKVAIKEYCPLADDIWLNVMSVLNKTLVVKTNYPMHYIPIMYKDNDDLYKLNVYQNKNNDQIKALECKYGSLFFEKKDSRSQKLDDN
ncbi:glycosyltransferase [Acinetobacter baumannii]|uniref:glycosyltransferase n=1 Tax=Acinetobacter baumannii TaxID=470 RepID=UPI0038928CCA